MKHKKIYEDGKLIPQRMCVACRQVKPKKDMQRVCKSGEVIKLDFGTVKTGRGAYVCKSEECIKKAQKSRGFERSFKSAVDRSLYEECFNIYEK